MSAARKRKLLQLEEFRRRLPHISARALSETLSTIKEHGCPDLDSRQDMHQARELAVNENTPYGQVSTVHEVTHMLPGRAPVKLRIANMA